MTIFLVNVALVIGCFFFGEFLAKVWSTIHDYEVMRSRGWKLAKSEDGEYFWIGYDD